VKTFSAPYLWNWNVISQFVLAGILSEIITSLTGTTEGILTHWFPNIIPCFPISWGHIKTNQFLILQGLFVARMLVLW